MLIPTPQEKVLTSPARIRVVRAVPGSGKTWLIAEAIRKELKGWAHSNKGIAALSFTNVARDEIYKALGYELTHPHFVGTIDSFVYRFIARPFARLYNPDLKPLCLVPANQAALLDTKQYWANAGLEVQLGSAIRRANIFRINFVGEEGGKPILTARMRDWESPAKIPPQLVPGVLSKKVSIWKSSGRVSHSDVAYIASNIIFSEAASFLRDVLVRRFPILFVDELQDTGWFLGRILLQLLSHGDCRALIVGDPDQAIYEFNGAKPELFDDFEKLLGADVFPIETSRRCPKRICRVAELLTLGKRTIRPERSEEGRTVMAVYDGAETHFLELCRALGSAKPKLVTSALTRSNRTVEKLKGGIPSRKPGFHKPLLSLHRAVDSLRQGNMTQAYSLATAAVARPLAGIDAMSDTEFEEFGIDPFQWKKCVVNILIHANEDRPSETLYDWGCRMREAIETKLKEFGWWGCNGIVSKTPRRPQLKTKDATRSDFIAPYQRNQSEITFIPIQTVHAVKGETHHTTLLYVPKPQSDIRCPSSTWWINQQELQEERRIAFVAATRATDTLIICVHRETFERFQKHRPEFVQAFEVKPLSELTSEILSLGSVSTRQA